MPHLNLQMKRGLVISAIIAFNLFLIPFSNGKFVISPEERKALVKFRPLVKNLISHDYQTTDSYLVRWLQAKKLNVGSAVQMFREAQKWRAQNQIDNLVNEKFPEFAKFKIDTSGVDFQGRTVMTMSLGDWEIRRVVLSGQQNRFLRYHLQKIEQVVSASARRLYRSNGTLSNLDIRHLTIVDVNGFSQNHACLACMSLYIKDLFHQESYYPGVAALDITINTPRAALPIIKTLQSFASEQKKAGLKVFGGNKTEWQQYIRSIIPKENLTFQFGGIKAS